MAQELTVAMKTAKDIEKQLVVSENRLEYIKSEVGNLQKQKELLEATIAAKTADYQTYVGSREKEIREKNEKLINDCNVLETQREEFKNTLNAHISEKSKLAGEQAELEKQKTAMAGRKQAINDFVQAVRRAYNVLPD